MEVRSAAPDPALSRMPGYRETPRIPVCQGSYGNVCFEDAAKPVRVTVMGAARSLISSTLHGSYPPFADIPLSSFNAPKFCVE